MKKKSKSTRRSKGFIKNFLASSSNQVNWINCVAGIVVGYLGSKQLMGNSPRWLLGIPMEAIAGWLFWIAFPSRISVPPEKKSVSPARKTRSLPNQPLWFLLLLLIPAGIGQYYFFSERLAPGLIAWAVALLLACILKFRATEGALPSSPRLENLGLVLILLAAALMRFPFVAQHMVGLQIDEANNIQDSYTVIDGGFRSPYMFCWGGNESLPFFIYALVFKLFGKSFVVAQAFSSVLSMAALYFFYYWCRMFLSSKASLAATFLLSVSWWFLFYSFSPFHNMLVVLFEVLSFYFLEKCLREDSKINFALLGVFMALGVLGYLPGRLIPIMVALVVLVFAASDIRKFMKVYFRPFLLTAFFFLLLLAPFILNVCNDSGEFIGRGKQLGLWNEVQRTGHYDLIFTRSFWTLMSFAYPAESYDERFNLHHNPEMDPVTGLLLYFGLLVALLSPLKRWSWQALIGFLLGATANAFAIQGPDPEPIYINCMRFFLITPFLFFLGGRAIDWFSGLFMGSGKKSQAIQIIVLLAAMFFSVFWNSRIFYDQFHHSRSGWAFLGFNHIAVADYLKSQYPRCHILLDYQFDSSTVQVLTLDKVRYTIVNPLRLPLNYKVDKNVMLVFIPGDFDENLIRKTYPNAVWDKVGDEWGDTIVKTAEIPKADVEALQEGQPPPTTTLP